MLALGLTIYVRIRPRWVSVRVVPRQGEATQAEGVAKIAARLTTKGIEKVVAIGEEANAIAGGQDVTIYEAFCHPRVLIGGVDKAQLVVGEFLRRACAGRTPLLRFHMVIHLADEVEGGLTDVEERALMELGLRLGASRVLIHQGPEDLSDEQIVALRHAAKGTL